MKEFERQLKALANKRRLAILKYLKVRKEASVAAIADEINLSFKATSKHLSILSAADILEKEQRSSRVFYRITSSPKPIAKQVVNLL